MKYKILMSKVSLTNNNYAFLVGRCWLFVAGCQKLFIVVWKIEKYLIKTWNSKLHERNVVQELMLNSI